MATFYSNNFGGRQLRLEIWQEQGYCHWQLFSEGGETTYYTIYSLSIAINGTTVYSPGTVNWDSYKFPAAKGNVSGSVLIGNGASAQTIYISFIGRVYYSGTPQNGGNFTMAQYIWAPTLSSMSISNIGDKSVSASFSVSNNNGQAPSSPNIDISLTNFGTVIKTSASRSASFSGLDPNRTYYVRGNDANDAGRTYTNVSSFTTTFNNPGAPGAPVLSYDQSEPIPSANLKATWTAGSAGSTAIAGYRVRLYKNGTEVKCIDTENTSITYTFGTFESLGFVPGDVARVGIYSYSKDWAGNKHFNSGGASSAQIYSSNTITEVSDKYVYISSNGGSFIKYKMYTSINGGSFTELKKEKFKVIK